MEQPTEPPTDWAAAMITVLIPSTLAVSTCSPPNMTLALVLLPVRKAPSTPISGEKIGKKDPVAVAIPWASRLVMPVSFMIRAIMTMVRMPMLVGTHWEKVVFRAATAVPGFQRPVEAEDQIAEESCRHQQRRRMRQDVDPGIHFFRVHGIAKSGFQRREVESPGKGANRAEITLICDMIDNTIRM